MECIICKKEFNEDKVKTKCKYELHNEETGEVEETIYLGICDGCSYKIRSSAESSEKEAFLSAFMEIVEKKTKEYIEKEQADLN